MRKFAALLLAAVLLWSCMAPSMTAMAASVSDSATELHFIIRHWHTKQNDEGSMFGNGDGSTMTSSGDRYFVMVEGWIVPKDPSESDYNSDRKYEFDLLDSNGNRVRIHNNSDDADVSDEDYAIDDSNYIDRLDHTNGIITLSTNQLSKDNSDDNAEVFSSFSVSAGHDAVEANGSQLTITYKKNIHLVKAHAFYVKTTVDTDNGTQDDTVFGTDGIAMSAEQDTAMVYTYKDGVKGHKKGEIVKDKDGNPITAFKKDKNDNYLVDEDGLFIMDESALPAGIDSNTVVVTKVYDSGKGLHTDKTASINADWDDGRTFDLDLEVWHSEGLAPQIGLVLDASGSMAFASDKPTPIKVEAGTELYHSLAHKIGKYDSSFKATIPFPQSDKLLGYYEFQQNGQGKDADSYRTWYLNTKTGGNPANYNSIAKYESASETLFAKLILQSNNDNFDFSTNNQQTLKKCGSYNNVTSWGEVPINFSNATGVNLTGAKQTGSERGSGILLESASNLTGSGFTLSFSLNQTKDISPNGDVEILYIGPETGTQSGSSYFRVIRRNNNIIASVIADGQEQSSVTLPTAFGNGVKHLITFAYDGGKMTAYMDGMEQASFSVSDLSYKAIVFAPFKNANTVTGEFWLDNVYLFDATLNGGEINTLISVSGDALTETVRTDAFLTLGELALLMNPSNTDASLLGWAGYSYFVYDHGENTMAYTPLAYKGANGAVFAREHRPGGDGWYYVNATSDKTSIGNARTAKQLQGLVIGTYKDKIMPGLASLDSVVGQGGTAPDVSASDVTSGANTEIDYANGTASPVKFYIDRDGYLRCFFSSGDTARMTSYVYELNDKDYIRTEALQRALGLFVTELDERSPSARVSAVRFSAGSGTFNSNELVLLGWTDDPAISTGMLSLGQNDKDLYKYVLTGGTDTASGLQAYIDHLQGSDNPYHQSAGMPPKYLILFTDGMNTGNQNTAKTNAATLKKAGYTIYTILLDGGSMSKESYEAAEAFLTSLAGTKDSASGDTYFYSTHKAKENGYTGNDTDILTQMFVDEILNQITKPLTGYTVQDYIDPRFDLVDKDGIVWHLNAKGIVTKEHEGGIMPLNELDLSASGGEIFPLSDHSDEGAQEPYLCYDSTNDMYCLVWQNQSIPGSTVGANRLAVWNARVTIRAKDDFLGGNAVISNGHKENMNYVYANGDTHASSGTDHANPGENDNFLASKGFPRTAVNVTPAKEELNIAQTIYMGEELYAKDIAVDLIRTTSEQATGLEQYYWEYLERFVTYFNQSGNLAQLEALATKKDASGNSVITDRMKETAEKGKLSIETLTAWMIEDRDKGLTLPYIYLPALDQTNSTGTEIHRRDVIGQLNYIIKDTYSNADIVPEGYDVYPDGPTTHTITRLSQLQVTYSTEDSVTRMAWNNSNVVQEKDNNGNLIYRRIPRYKPVPGDKVEKEIVIKGDFVTEIVSGEIALQVVVSPEAQAKLSELKQTVTYTADLYFGAERVGVFTARIQPGQAVVNATIEFLGDYKTGIPGQVADMEHYGLPYGTYTLKNGQGSNVPDGFVFGSITLIDDKSQYNSSLFSKGVGKNSPQDYMASISGDSFILGDRSGTQRYTNYRFGLYQVSLAAPLPGELTINKAIRGDADKAITDAKAYSFTIIGPDAVKGNTYDNVTFDADGKATVTITGEGSVTIKGLPVGTYSVTENRGTTGIDGYTLTVTGEGDVEITNDRGATVTVTNTYTVLPGSLTIAKVLGANAPSEASNKTYTFTIIGPDAVKGQRYGNVAFDADGKATVTITGANSVTVTGLPAGTYSVAEDQNGAAITGHSLEVTGEGSATITNGSSATVAVTNTYTALPGSLTIAKALGANAPSEASNKTYAFTITGPDAVKGQRYGNVAFDADGKATVTITGANSVTVTGLPAGTYSVAEDQNGAAITGYSLEVKGEGSATITNGSSATVEVTNTYTVLPGSLTIAKALGANAPSEASNKTYTFTIIGPDAVKGQRYGNVAFDADGKATVTITGANSVTVTGLPAGTYSVAEDQNGAAITGYSLEVKGEGSATITNGSSATVAVTNTYTALPGSLTIAKALGANAPSEASNKTYAFTITGPDAVKGQRYGNVAFDADGKATVTITGANSVTVTGLPAGTYSVAEDQNGAAITGYSLEVKGEGSATITNGSSASLTITNIYTRTPPEPTAEPAPQVGDLIVSKTVTGNAGDKSQEFSFMVMLSDVSINGVYGDLTFHNGVATFMLKHGQKKVVTALPTGIRYSVMELSAEQAGYAVTSMNADGVISVGQSAEALFINAREEADVPQTGDNSHLEWWITLAFLALMGMTASIFIIHKDMKDRKRIR